MTLGPNPHGVRGSMVPGHPGGGTTLPHHTTPDPTGSGGDGASPLPGRA
jgi:hypothetical protein